MLVPVSHPLGAVAGHYDMTVAFLVISVAMLASGIIWLFGMKYLAADTAVVEAAQLLSDADKKTAGAT